MQKENRFSALRAKPSRRGAESGQVLPTRTLSLSGDQITKKKARLAEKGKGLATGQPDWVSGGVVVRNVGRRKKTRVERRRRGKNSH